MSFQENSYLGITHPQGISSSNTLIFDALPHPKRVLDAKWLSNPPFFLHEVKKKVMCLYLPLNKGRYAHSYTEFTQAPSYPGTFPSSLLTRYLFPVAFWSWWRSWHLQLLVEILILLSLISYSSLWSLHLLFLIHTTSTIHHFPSTNHRIEPTIISSFFSPEGDIPVHIWLLYILLPLPSHVSFSIFHTTTWVLVLGDI